MSAQLGLVLKVVIAAVVGGMLGFEREIRGHEPGLRTHALVAVGAALFTIAGAYGFTDIRTDGSYDPARVAAQVAAGIGFIGAGAMLRSGGSIRGLTTAATLWVSAAIGVGAGAGVYGAVAAAAIVTLLVLVVLRLAKPKILARFGGGHRVVFIEYERGHGTLGPVMRELEAINCRVSALRLEDDDVACRSDGGMRKAMITVQTVDENRLIRVLDDFKSRREIVAISVDPIS